MSTGFYKAFEDKFRGSRELVKSRLEVYLPFIKPLKKIYPEALALDLGCGRCEWLELLIDVGFNAQGVDLDEHMLSVGKNLGFNVHLGDAVAFLKNIPDQSQVIVSAFHLVEHIAFSDLQTIVEESLRVLRPGGLLIMETPNPENIVVGTSSFYIDPTHNRPIPPHLLAFVPEYYGFERIKIVRLQECELNESSSLSLLSVLSGVSPDYAVVAQKNASTQLLQLTEEPFQVEYGVTLEHLASIYSQDEARDKLDAQWLKQEWETSHLKIQELESELQSIYRSKTWRFMQPFRGVVYSKFAEKFQESSRAFLRVIRKQYRFFIERCKIQWADFDFKNHAKNIKKRLSTNKGLRTLFQYSSQKQQVLKVKTKEKVKLLLQHAKAYIGLRPRLKKMILSMLNRFPSLKNRLMRIGLGGFSTPSNYSVVPTELRGLTPQARAIYKELKSLKEPQHNNESI